jgi:hypothetical protein
LIQWIRLEGQAVPIYSSRLFQNSVKLKDSFNDNRDDQKKNPKQFVGFKQKFHSRFKKSLDASQSHQRSSRKAKLIRTINQLKKNKNRLLPIGPLLDFMTEPRYDLLPLIMPTSIPQVSDARITVQTFNPPPMPLEPGMVPAADYQFKVKLPEIKHQNKRTKEVNLTIGGKFTEVMKNVVAGAFNRALKKHDNAHLGNIDHPNDYIINVFEDNTERYLDSISINARIARIANKIKHLREQHEEFGSQIQDKIRFLDVLLSKLQKTKLDYIIV